MPTTNTLDRYRDLEVLGSGGMGTVTLAEDTMLGRPVALKRVHTDGDARGLSRLRREALVGASLNHPNLVSVYDVVTDPDGDLVVVMEYVAGETLRSAVRRRSGLPVAQAMRVLEGVATGLDAIHRRGIVHRDVKPANILLGTDGAIKLADLGVASVSDRTQITTEGAVMGTFSYMAPEQLEGASSDPAMDIYALSAVAYEVLSGRKAHPEPNPLALAHAISTQPPPDLREAWEQASADTAAVLQRGMARDPAERPRSAGELVSRLRESIEPHVTPAGSPPRPVGPPAPAAGAAGVAWAAANAAHAAPAGAAPARAAPAGAASADAGRPDTASAPAAGARSNRRRGWLVPAALLGVAAAVVAVVLSASSGGGPQRALTASGASHHRSSSAGARSAAPVAGASSKSTTATTASQSAPAAPAATPAAPSSTPGAIPATTNPVGAVEAFYGLATQHRYQQAWQLADPQAQGQLGGYRSFVAQQSATRSISFHQARIAAAQGDTATVALQTTSVRSDGSHECSGSVSLVKTATTWRVDRFQGITCS